VNLAPPAKAESESSASPWAEATKVAQGRGILVDMGSKVVNLADPGGFRYLRVGLVFEFVPLDPSYHSLDENEKTEMEERQRKMVEETSPLIDDIVIGLLSNKTFGQIFTIEGKDLLKEELRLAINERLGNNLIINIYFTDFVIQ